MQRTHGNVAVTRMIGGPIIQRNPPTAQRPKAAVENAKRLTDDFWDIVMELNEGNAIQQSRWRADLGNDMVATMADELERMFDESGGADARMAIAQVAAQLDVYRSAIRQSRAEALDMWADLQRECNEEVHILRQEGDNASLIASGVLGAEFERTQSLVSRMGSVLTVEDLSLLDDMLGRGTHVEKGEQQAAQEERELEAAYDEFADDDEPGLWEGLFDIVTLKGFRDAVSGVWEVVGWESKGDFAKDVAVTGLTGGLGKVFRGMRKGKKMRSRMKAVKRARRAAKARKGQKAIESAQLLGHLAALIGEAASLFGDQLKWARSNWDSLARKIVTDVGGEAIGGDVRQVPSAVLSRLRKEQINEVVERMLDTGPSEERRTLRMAFGALRAKKEASARRLTRVYLGANGRRRLVTNMVHIGITKTGRLELPVDPKVVGQIANTTVLEMVQDMVTAIPLFELPIAKDAVETARKALEQVIEENLQ